MTATLTRAPSPATPTSSNQLYEVLDLILDKGLVIDAYVRVSLVGIELLTVDARVVVASVDTYLRFAEATNRLDLRGKGEATDEDLGDMVESTTGAGQAKQALERGAGVVRKGAREVAGAFSDGEEDEENDS